jgi:Methyltransferase domain
MKMRLTKKDTALVLGAAILLLSVGVIGWSLLGDAAVIMLSILFAVLATLVLVVLLDVYRRVSDQYQDLRRSQESQRNAAYRQIESLFSLFFTIKPTLPLPEMRGWAASPDLLKKITEVILTETPDVVVEASSGASTLVIAYCLKQLGKGKVISLEHDAKHAEMSRRLISFHSLENIATVLHAPLTEIVINDQKWLWYDTACLKVDRPIDLLVVDGPPGHLQALSRYPALPVLYRQLSKKATIILDDGRRDDEKKIVLRWEQEFQISSEFLNLEKGAYVVHKND